MSEITILQAFEGMPDYRRGQGKRHPFQLCLALFTLAIAAGNRGFEAIGDWLKFHRRELGQLFEVESIPSYSTIRRVLPLSGLCRLCREIKRILWSKSFCWTN